MKPVCTRITIIALVLAVIVLSSAESNAQATRVSWDGAAGTPLPYTDAANWDINFVPSGGFGEYASISNGGISVINSAVSDFVLDLLVAEDGSSTGGLIIQDGGSITVDQVVDGAGQLRNGVSGVGTVTLHDAMGSVVVDGYTQNANSTLNVEIGGTAFNPVVASDEVTLNGILQVNGALASAGPGSSWTLFDGSAGGAAVTGQFNQIVNNTSFTFGEGQSFTVSTANNSVTLGIEQELLLRVDPYAGTAVLSNPAGSGVDFEMTGYAMSVLDGTMEGSQWVSFTDDGVSGLVEASRPTQVGETSAAGMITLAPGTDKDFGSPLRIDLNQPLGTDVLAGAVSFEFSTPDGQIIDAMIVREGDRQNNLVLVVNPDDGSAVLQNQSTQAADLTGYVIESDSGALLTTWGDLEGQGVLGWDVVAETANALAELNPENSSMLGAGDTLDLGTLWDVSTRDISLQFSIPGSSTSIAGAVFYGDPLDIGGVSIPGDYNDNGLVEQGDLDLVLLNWGDGVPPTPAGWVNQIPDDGAVDQNDLDGVLLNWGNGSVSAAAAAVPEPASLAMVVTMGMVGLLLRSRRGTSPRDC